MAHFGQWVKKIRNKLGLSQQQWADALSLKTREGVALIEKRSSPKLRGDTLESLLEFLGYSTLEEMNVAWRTGAMPDLNAIERRLGFVQPAQDDAYIRIPAESYEALSEWAKSLGHPSIEVYLLRMARIWTNHSISSAPPPPQESGRATPAETRSVSRSQKPDPARQSARRRRQR